MATKRTLAACDAALNNLSDEELLQKLGKNFSHYSSKLKRHESELNSFCKRTGLLPDRSRQQAYGFGRSTAQKAVWKNEKQKVYAAANSDIRNTGKVLEFIAKQVFIKVAPKHSFFVSILHYLLQIQLLNDNVIPIL